MKKCEDFLIANGFKRIDPLDDEGKTYEGNGILVDITDDSITLLDDEGDFAQVPLNYYALIGVLFTSRIIGASFIDTHRLSSVA